MPTTPTTGDAVVRNLEERFLDLICGDAGLLAAEFDAIVAAEWPDPPADSTGRGVAGTHRRSGPARRAAEPGRGPAFRPGRPGFGGSTRQRSPPFPTPTPDRQEGR